jgi:nucleoside-specific outer membrane channel protein Tsx
MSVLKLDGLGEDIKVKSFSALALNIYTALIRSMNLRRLMQRLDELLL